MQLNKTERQEISLHLQKGYSLRSIAKMLGRNHSTISREIKRNSLGQIAYDPHKANHKKYVRRKYCKFRCKKIRTYPVLEDYIKKKLQRKWSPEQIAGRWNT